MMERNRFHKSQNGPQINVDFDGTEEYTSDEYNNEKGNNKQVSWVMYVIVSIFFLSGLYGMAALTGIVPRDIAQWRQDTPSLREVRPFPVVAAPVASKIAQVETNPIPEILQIEKAVASADVAPKSEPRSIVQGPPKKNREPDLQLRDSGNGVPPKKDINIVEKLLLEQIEILRSMKQSGVVMELDDLAKLRIADMQNTCRDFLLLKYGPGPYYLQMDLVFPDTMPDFDINGAKASVGIELAPIEFVPYSVYYFLDIVERWKGGAFHRNAGHVLQAKVNAGKPSLAFQEYHPNVAHNKFTLGYAGRPGGPEFYISAVNNVKNHGPGSQGSKTEADSCFGKLFTIKGLSNHEELLKRLLRQPGAGNMGFVSSSDNFIRIPLIKLLTRAELDSLST